MRIPFNVPFISDETFELVCEVLKNQHQHGDGIFATKVVGELAKIEGSGIYKLTPSCTASLEICSQLINLKVGDEVILPDYTFPSAAVSVTRMGAKPIFVDIDNNTKCIDVNLIEEKINKRTRAISWVNYAGATPDLEKIKEISEKYGLWLIEDNAHVLGLQSCGKTGDFVTQSFHATKNVQCGEGGSIKLQNRSLLFVDRLEQIREKGTNRQQFIRGNLQKYEWVDEGGSYLISELSASVLYSQLRNYQKISEIRRRIFREYKIRLAPHLQNLDAIWSNHENHELAAHMFFIDFRDQALADMFISSTEEKGIQVNKHYQSLSKSKYGINHGLNNWQVANSVSTSKSLVRLPIYPELEPRISKVNEIIEEILSDMVKRY